MKKEIKTGKSSVIWALKERGESLYLIIKIPITSYQVFLEQHYHSLEMFYLVYLSACDNVILKAGKTFISIVRLWRSKGKERKLLGKKQWFRVGKNLHGVPSASNSCFSGSYWRPPLSGYDHIFRCKELLYYRRKASFFILFSALI